MRRLLPLLLLAAPGAFADSILAGFEPPPLFQPQGAIIINIRLGEDLFWAGPVFSPGGWDLQLFLMPPTSPTLPFGPPIAPFDTLLLDPLLLSLQPANPPRSDTPEPATFSMLALALFAAALLLRRRATLN